MNNDMTQTPADVRELAGEIIRSLDLIARNYDNYEYGLPVMTHYDEMVDTVVALLRAPRGDMERVATTKGGDMSERTLQALRDRINARLQTSAISRDRASAAGREVVAQCRQSDVETLEWVLSEIDAVLATPEPGIALLRTPRGEGEAEALAAEILAELRRAREKFPGNNVMTLALVEEVGELAKATFEESRDRVRQEAIQVAVMAMRVVLDGDRTLDAWREAKGLDPLVVAARRGEGGGV